MRYDWQVGQEVTVTGNRGILDIRRIERVTKTLVVLDDGTRHRISNGLLIPCDGLSFYYIRPATDKDRLAAHRWRLLSDITQVKWDKLPLEQLVSIHAILFPVEKEGGKK